MPLPELSEPLFVLVPTPAVLSVAGGTRSSGTHTGMAV